MIYSVDVDVTAPVRATELTDRVREAIQTVFPAAEPVESHGELRATVHDLERFSELLHRREIPDTARDHLRANVRGEQFSFRLKKQPALESVVTFEVDESAELGAIAVQVHVDEPDPETFIEYLTTKEQEEPS